jgi:hypothetical protein
MCLEINWKENVEFVDWFALWPQNCWSQIWNENELSLLEGWFWFLRWCWILSPFLPLFGRFRYIFPSSKKKEVGPFFTPAGKDCPLINHQIINFAPLKFKIKSKNFFLGERNKFPIAFLESQKYKNLCSTSIRGECEGGGWNGNGAFQNFVLWTKMKMKMVTVEKVKMKRGKAKRGGGWLKRWFIKPFPTKNGWRIVVEEGAENTTKFSWWLNECELFIF